MSPDRKRLLIVEDDAEQRTALGHILSIGAEPVFDVLHATSGVEGLALCCSSQPDCVLLDYYLPDIDGLTFLTELAGEHGLTPFPVVMLTGRGTTEIDREAIRLGAQDYLEKGNINASALKRTIRRALERHLRLRHEVEQRRRAEEALHALNRSMEARVEQRAAALHESEARVRAILNTAAEGIVTFDDRGVIQAFNPAAEPLFGYPAEEVVGTSIDRLLPGSLEPASAVQGERLGVRADGTRFPVEVTLSHLPLERQRLSIAIVRDVTERKKAEAARRLFLTATSQDVRNALAVIAGYAAALSDGLPEDQAHKALARITSIAHTLSSIVSNIVVHAGLEGEDEIFWRPVAVRTLLTETAKDIEALCQQRGLRLLVTLPEEVTVLADKPKLTRILQNLLSNAVRYTERGEIELRGEVTEAQLRLTVRDTGIGIPAADLPRVFEEYYRHEQARVLHELGSGLGLATVRRLCDVLGGTVTVTSTPGQGSTFVVTVPHRGRAS